MQVDVDGGGEENEKWKNDFIDPEKNELVVKSGKFNVHFFKLYFSVAMNSHLQPINLSRVSFT